MSPANTERLYQALEKLNATDQLRQLPISPNQTLLNIASNDYLGLGTDENLQAEFLASLETLPTRYIAMGATSSRLLADDDEQLQCLETELEDWFRLAIGIELNNQKEEISTSALVFNSGYHANSGILPALTSLPINTLILADKLVHASIIDGIQLSQSKHCQYRRYRHNDYEQLATLIDKATPDIERIIIVTESIFSMDGDRADLARLVQLKAVDSRIELYVDEAHAVGVLGDTGLGLAEETKTLGHIDYIIGTFGKAFASVGAYLLCDGPTKQWLINRMRPLIFSTALPPINHAWTRFVLAKMPTFTEKRAHVARLSIRLQQAIENQNDCVSTTLPSRYQSPIIPYILGDNATAMAKAQQLQQAGFYARAVRPPTVPVNTARIRMVMTAALNDQDIDRLIKQL